MIINVGFTMTWKLFIDDIRKPDKDFILARNVSEAVKLIEEKGFPIFISFDHDLGENEPSGKDFVNMICDKVLDGEWTMDSNFEFQVHSDNSVGAENIKGMLNSFLRHKGYSFQLRRCQPYSSRVT